MCKSHAEYLLKAITFWELRYDSKYEEWKSKFSEAERARILRLQLKRGQISPGEAASREVIEDDGYESGCTDEEYDHEWEDEDGDDDDEDGGH